MPYYGDGAPHYYSGPYANHSSLMTSNGRSYHNPIAARYSPHLSTISESPLSVLRRYSPAASATKTSISSIVRPRRIIDTADIDVSKPPRTLTQENRQQRHRLRRDRPTIKIRSQALKDNPALREYNEKHEKTVGELLVEKFLIKDKQLEDNEPKIKLYHQASLMPNDASNVPVPLDKACENDLLDEMRRQVTRRMTRRRSSADVVPLNPEQLEREAAFHAAQAVALDTLVAEEQAELEVEARRGTFAKRPMMKLPSEISEVEETEEEDDPKQETNIDLLNKHMMSKKKKKKKSGEDDSLAKSDSVEEFKSPEEEFEWDEREKCDDIRLIVPAMEEKVYEKQDDDAITTNDVEINENKGRAAESLEKVGENEAQNVRKVKRTSKASTILKTDDTSDVQTDVKKRTVGVKVKSKDKTDEADVNAERIKKRKKEQTKVDQVQAKRANEQDVKIKKQQLTESSHAKEKDNKLRTSKNDIEVTKEVENFSDADKNICDTKKKVPKQLKRAVSEPQKDTTDEGDDPIPTFKVEACNSVGDLSTLFVKASNSPPLSARTIEQFRESIRLPAPRKFGAMGNSDIETKVVLPVRKPYVRDTSRNSVYLALKPGQNIRQRPRFGVNDSSSNITDEIRKESSARGSIASRSAKYDANDQNRSMLKSDSFISEESDELTLIDNSPLSTPQSDDHVDNELMNFGSKSQVLPFDKNIGKSVVRNKEEFVSWWDEIEEETSVELEKESRVPDTGEKSKNKSIKIKKRDTETTKKTGSVEISDKSDKSVNVVAKNKFANKVLDSKEKVAKAALENQIQRGEKLKKTSAHKNEPLLPKGLSKGEKEKSVNTAKKIANKEIALSPVISDDKLHIDVEEKAPNSDAIKIRCDLSKNDQRLPNIPEEPKSTSPTEKKESELFPKASKTNDSNEPKYNKSLRTKEKSSFSADSKKAEQVFDKLNLTSENTATKNEKEDRKKKVDAEAIMKIEKKILEDAESPRKILTTAIPKTQLIEASPLMTSTKKEKELESTTLKKKVGLLPTKKKSSEIGARQSTEIDFWSEIKAQESVKVSGRQRKAQLRIDSPTEESEQAKKSGKNLKLDFSKIPLKDQGGRGTLITEDDEELKTPLISDLEDLTATSISTTSPIFTAESNDQIPLIDSQLSTDSGSSVVDCHASAEVDQNERETLKKKEVETSTCVEETSEITKKISKWSKHDNLADLKEIDRDSTSITPKEASPQISVKSTTTKKKVTKKKKSSTTGKKKSTEKTESAKVSTKTKVTVKKVAPSPQTSQLKAPMSVSGSPRNTPSQRPADLKKLFYNTPAILLTATPRDLRKVRRAKAKKKNPTIRTLSLSSDSTGSTRSTATTSTEDSSNCEEDAEQRRLASTRSNDSGFDGSPRLSNCDMVCHKKCEKLTGNLCGLNQKLVAEALQAVKKAPSQSSENQRNETEHYQHSGRITPPATNLPRFKKYEVTDFNFLKVLGKGSFGKVLLAELRGTECVYAVKCLKKDVVLEDDDVECTLIERKVLTLATRHPYLCHLFCTFQTESHLFFVMEYLNGGDLMFHIQKSGRFSEPRAKFYAAEIWSGLIFLHKKGIVYRDLKLDNVLLDFEGHIRIADFGMCKLQIFLDRTADTFCGTPDYMAPEIIKGLKYNQAVDWWSFGVLLYEMLTGQSPFSGCDEDELFWSICNERPFIPRYLSQSSTDMLICLLEKDAGKRIPGHEIACHPFFCTIAWDKLERRALEAPFKPAVEHTLDTRYFDTAFTAERPRLTPVPDEILTSMDQAVFRGFSYTNPNATD